MFGEFSLCLKIFYILLYPILFLLSGIYLLVTSFRNLMFDLGIKKVNVLEGKTISVGNIDVGGTGKTPVTIDICNFLIKQGFRVAVLSRGYGSNLRSDESIWIKDSNIYPLNLKDETKLKDLICDEPRLISFKVEGLYVIVGAKRFLNAKRFLDQTGARIDYWVLDDGFQHRGIYRQLDILLVDSKRMLSSFLLPCGRSRERLSGVKRAGLILFTRSTEDRLTDKNKDLADRYNKKAYSASFNGAGFYLIKKEATGFKKERVSVDYFLSKKIAALSGISKNKQFISMVKRELNLDSFYYECLVYDHLRFDKRVDRAKIKEVDLVLTTSKDYFRDPGFFEGLGRDTVIFDLELSIDKDFYSDILSGTSI